MRYSVLLDRLQNLINYKPSQSEIGKILDLRQTAISGRANRDSNENDNLLLNNQLCNIKNDKSFECEKTRHKVDLFF